MTKPWSKAAKLEEDNFGELFARWRSALANALSSPEFLPHVWPDWQSRLVTPDLPNLWYVPDFIGLDAERGLTEHVHGSEYIDRWRLLSRRRILCLGGVPHPDGAICEQLQGPLGCLAEALHSCGALRGLPDQCFVNSYAPGEGIDAHLDGPRFLPEVAIVNLEGAAVLNFS